jgi:hypothetical protein
MSQRSISDLPEEMMLRIFNLLPPQDLKSAMLVCREWKEIGEDPTLGSWSVVRLKSRQEYHKLNIRRFQLIRELDMPHSMVKVASYCQIAIFFRLSQGCFSSYFASTAYKMDTKIWLFYKIKYFWLIFR